MRTVSEFVENPMMLEAAMVRCSVDRVKTRYDAECLNARQAVRQIEAKEEAARRTELEVRSESKRLALRRAQEAAAEARRRVIAAQKRRQEAEYLAQFGVAPPANSPTDDSATVTGNSPLAVIPRNDEPQGSGEASGDISLATDGGNAPTVSTESVAEEDAPDLSSIRDELQRRNEDGTD